MSSSLDLPILSTASHFYPYILMATVEVVEEAVVEEVVEEVEEVVVVDVGRYYACLSASLLSLGLGLSWTYSHKK
jgi:hypothetical protein